MIKCTLQCGDTLRRKLEFGNVGFSGEGKTGVPKGKPLEARTRTNNKLNPHMMVMVMVTLFRQGKSFSNDIKKKR